MNSTAGLTSLGENFPTKDSYVVQVIRRKGGIPFVHTNVPQGLFAIDSSNFLWGRCDNPWNKSKITGGFSGGEGGMIAALCSPLGIGSDLGGSIRIPSVLCGLYGLRPTANRISQIGCVTYNGTEFAGFNNFASCFGPICKSPQDLKLITQHLFGEFELDVNVNNRRYTTEDDKKVKKIGYFYNFDENHSSLPIKNAVLDVVTKLRSKGHQLVEFPAEKFTELIDTGFTLVANGGAIGDLPHTLQGEKSL